MSDVNCPYCDKEIEICNDDGFGLDESKTHQYECPHCEKYFVFTASICVSYEAGKADCLNDGQHHYKMTRHYPIRYRRMRCTVCGDEKSMQGELNGQEN